MGAAGTKQGKSGVPSKQKQLKSKEIFEETIDAETLERKDLPCDRSLIDCHMNVIAFYFCIVCGRYYCKECFTGHDRSHKYIRAESKDRELESEIADFVSFMMNESDDESEKKLMENEFCVGDYVKINHELDIFKKCVVFGLTGYANKWWIACDVSNHCVKIFSLGSNVLQRYIRFGSSPFDVTEIVVENKTTEQDSASCSETAISGTENKPDRKYLLAVTVRGFIFKIDLGKNPAVIHSKIKTKEQCYSIDFYDGNIYALVESSHNSPNVYIMSVEGVTLKTFQIRYDFNWYSSFLTVLNGNIYMTKNLKNIVVCYNDEGRILHEITIDRSYLDGNCVDRSEDKGYVYSFGNDKVYELESDLSRYKPVLDYTTQRTQAIRFYSDKLYVVHGRSSEYYVTVVRLL